MQLSLANSVLFIRRYLCLSPLKQNTARIGHSGLSVTFFQLFEDLTLLSSGRRAAGESVWNPSLCTRPGFTLMCSGVDVPEFILLGVYSASWMRHRRLPLACALLFLSSSLFGHLLSTILPFFLP